MSRTPPESKTSLGLVMLPTAIVAGLLVVYFDWRVKLRNESWLTRDDRKKAAYSERLTS